MKKLFVLIALGGMGSFAAGCGEPATPPPVNPANNPASNAMHQEMMNKAKAGHDASGDKKDDAADKKDDAAPSDEATPDKKEGE